ncbi:MAG: DUF1460 domain-containing protein [Nitrospirae bacterium]|nr:DUF1460 domain-containing protein [Nitrospirota bacterium]
MRINLGKWTEESIDGLAREASATDDAGQRITFISRHFLATPYVGDTLVGSANTPETFVVELGGIDCLTFLEYVEALRLSTSYREFIDNLQNVRYVCGRVDFNHRRHFFSDWVGGTVEDITAIIGGDRLASCRKTLNLKEDETFYLPGIPAGQRVITYIPTPAFDETALSAINTGDYLGIYTPKPGIDVSHTGIAVRESSRVYLRHASSIRRMVIDEELALYMRGKPGLLVYRPKSLKAIVRPQP